MIVFECVLGWCGVVIVFDVDCVEFYDCVWVVCDCGGVCVDLDVEFEFSFRGVAVDVRGVRGVGVCVLNCGWDGWEIGVKDEIWIVVG